MQPFTPSPYAYAAPGSYQQAKPLDGLAKVVAILLGLVVLATLFSSFAFFHRNQAANDFLNLRRPGNSDLDTLSDADHLVGAGLALVGIASLAAWVVWVIWQFQHAKNAERLAGKGGLAPVFAIVGWIIPVGSLVLPPLELSGSSKASDPSLAPGAPRSGGKALGLIWVWWVAYVAGLVLFGVGSGQRPSQHDIGTSRSARQSMSDFADADKLVAIAALVLAVAAVLAIFVALKTTKRQTDRINAVASGAGAAGGPPAASYVPGGFGPPPAAGFGAQPSSSTGPSPVGAPPAEAGSWGPPGGGPAATPTEPASGDTSGFVVPGGGGSGPAPAAPSAPGAPSVEPGWHPDPHGEAELRWWDGRQWTNHISGQPSS